MDKEDLRALPAAAVGAVSGFNKYYMGNKLGVVAWLGLVASVMAYDAYAMSHEVSTLTRVAHEALNVHPILTRMAIGAVALHLGSPKYDPARLAYDFFK